ncbi:MAG: penicillin-binding protein activator LpoB [Cellvibrionales bacterium]|nr:penicillin-binding protein activator LpoB [Cellvibrionales bacterium]
MRLAVVSLCFATLLLSACSTVKYGDAKATETVNTDFGSTDLQAIAHSIVQDLLQFPPMVAVTHQKRPVMFIDGVQNNTNEHIDMQSITDSIQSDLIQSGKYRFVDPKAISRVKAQFKYQSASGLVDPTKAIQVGKHLGAEYMLYGNMTSITKNDGHTRDVYYKFTLKLMDLSTGILEWSSEKEIRKARKKSLLGL